MSQARLYAQSRLTMARAWHFVDAKDLIVGRLASTVSQLLQGKHKPIYDRSQDIGDHVVVVNAKDLEFTGDKWRQKLYRWHTGYVGNLKTKTALDVHQKNPARLLIAAVLGMLPKNNLRMQRMRRLHIYPDSLHPHQPQLLEFPGQVIESKKLITEGKDVIKSTKFEIQFVPNEKITISTSRLTPEEIKEANPGVKNIEALLKKKPPKVKRVGRPGKYTEGMDRTTSKLSTEELEQVSEFVLENIEHSKPEVLDKFVEELKAKRPLDWKLNVKKKMSQTEILQAPDTRKMRVVSVQK